MTETEPKPQTLKKDRRDRYDRIFVRNQDSMHILMPFMMPKRCDNEALLQQDIDISAIEKYVQEKNAQNPAFKYTFFHVIAAALAKTIILRPKMNYFISGDRLFERRYVELAFVVKRQMSEKGAESLAKCRIDPDGISPIEQVHSFVEKFVTMVRKENKQENTSDAMDILAKLPRFLCRFVFWALNTLEYFGIYPKSLAKMDPCYTSVFISNLGSIGMNANYHHIYERGTVSFFCIIGKKGPKPVCDEDGSLRVANCVSLGLTIDERIADGYYFSRSIALLQHLLSNPELLDLPASAPIEF